AARVGKRHACRRRGQLRRTAGPEVDDGHARGRRRGQLHLDVEEWELRGLVVGVAAHAVAEQGKVNHQEALRVGGRAGNGRWIVRVEVGRGSVAVRVAEDRIAERTDAVARGTVQ